MVASTSPFTCPPVRPPHSRSISAEWKLSEKLNKQLNSCIIKLKRQEFIYIFLTISAVGSVSKLLYANRPCLVVVIFNSRLSMLDLLWQRAVEALELAMMCFDVVVRVDTLGIYNLHMLRCLFASVAPSSFFLFFGWKWIIYRYIFFGMPKRTILQIVARSFINCSLIKWNQKMLRVNRQRSVFVYKLCASMRRTMISCRNRNMGVWEHSRTTTRYWLATTPSEWRERLTKRALGIQNQSHTAQSILFYLFAFVYIC